MVAGLKHANNFRIHQTLPSNQSRISQRNLGRQYYSTMNSTTRSRLRKRPRTKTIGLKEVTDLIVIMDPVVADLLADQADLAADPVDQADLVADLAADLADLEADLVWKSLWARTYNHWWFSSVCAP